MKSKRLLIVFCVIGVLFFAATWASADPLGFGDVYITSGPEGIGLADVVTDKPSVWISGTWYAPSADQHFSNPYTHGGSLPGDYVYEIEVDLTGYDLASVNISGGFATDDGGELFLNGADTGVSSPGYSSLTAFNLTSGFVSGINTLEFHVNNVDPGGAIWGGPDGLNPTGLTVQNLEGTATPALPEPTSLLTLCCGLGGLGLVVWRKRPTLG